MCAAPAKTSDEKVVAAAHRIVAREGVSALSMLAVASSVGVRAPSLYKRFPDKDALLDAIARRTMSELTAELVHASQGRQPGPALRAMAKAYRAFAKRAPHLYRLLYTKRSESAELRAARADAVAPVIAALAAVVPKSTEQLPAARLLTAFLHGFVSMELDGAFQLGGDVGRAFEFGLDTLLRGLTQAA